ncbi:MAG: UDP-N-acetylmuramoyl-L-alanine--D-glutamate ligase [Chloroflexi bacterium]|nr:MAG: UDP-N-acetylmuramoyl-L-alanine--D-glutamate ligase [Chloroflexota bacterium]
MRSVRGKGQGANRQDANGQQPARTGSPLREAAGRPAGPVWGRFPDVAERTAPERAILERPITERQSAVSEPNGGKNGVYSVAPVLDQDFVGQSFAGKKVVILGLARQGTALARFFAAAQARVVVSDLAPAEKLQNERAALGDLPVELVLGGHPASLLDDCALLCLSGGVPPQSALVRSAVERGIPLTNDSLLTLQMARLLGLGPTLAITGSSGKTTTTTLTGKILAAGRPAVHVGGNIGTPLLDRLATIQPGAPLVLELSSFQLELFDPLLAWGPLDDLGPDVAAILNITPNHLDRHPGMAAYADAKLNLLRHMRPGGKVIVNLDDPVTARLAPPGLGGKRKKLPAGWGLDDLLERTRALIDARGLEVIPFSSRTPLTRGAWLEGEMLVCQGEPVVARQEIRLRGDHNVGNLLAACAISQAAGAGTAAMAQVARTFTGVAHRLEIVAEHDGVTWINDSIATSPERAMAGLRSFEAGKQTLILLAGGKDKNLPWDAFANEALARVSFLIGFGHSGSMIVDVVQERARFCQQKAPNCAVVQRLEEAVELAARVAGPNSIVLLSPGGTSFDGYKDFEQRGEHFRQLVRRHIEGKSLGEKINSEKADSEAA